MLGKWFLGIWIWGLTAWVYGQDPYSITIDKTQGLPANAVYDVFQDSKGFMWFATDEGVCRYDGKKFKSYVSPLLTSMSSTCLHEDKYGRIWFMNFDNLVYYIENDTIKAVPQKPVSGLFLKYHILGNYLLIPQRKGLDVFTLKDLRLKNTFEFPEIMYTNGSENYYYMNDDQSHVYRVDSNLVIKEISNSKAAYISSSNQSILFYNKNNTDQKIEIWTPHTIQQSSFNYHEYITNISFTNDYIWVCTKNGVYRNNHTLSKPYQHFYPGKNISKVLKDKDGNYWISTTNEGVLLVPSLDNRFYLFNDFIPQQLQVYQNRVIMSGKTNAVIEFNPADETTRYLFKTNINHEISCFYYDTLHQSLLVTSDLFYVIKNGVTLLSKGTAVKSIVPIDDHYFSVAATGFCGLFQNSAPNQPTVWDSLHLLNPCPIKGYECFSQLIKNVRAKSTVYDKKNNLIYYATNTGLYKISATQTTEIKHQNTTIQARKLVLFKETLLVLQNNGMILQVNPNLSMIEYPLIIEGNLVAVNKIINRNQWLFICTSTEGIFKLDLNRPFSSIGSLYGISKKEDILDIEIWKDKYLISCAGGLFVLNQQSQTNKVAPPPFIINEIIADGQRILNPKKIWLPYNKNNIHISYSILSYNTSGEYPLYYRMNQGSWKLADPGSRELELASLQPDEYTIEFRLGSPTSNTLEVVKFTIGKPIWQIHWFWLGIFIIALIIVFGIYKWRINVLRKRNQLLIEKVELEKTLNKSLLTSIKAQMNPHFFYNALNTIQSFIFADDKRNASTYLSKFSKLTRLILEMSEKEVISLSEEIQALQLYLDIEKVRFNNKLNFVLEVDEKIDLEMTRFPPMLIQPYVENAIKHGLLHKKEDCRLMIKFSMDLSQLVVTIDDNGIGRVKSAQLNAIKENKHQSFATGANQKRLEILNPEKKEFAVKYIDKVDEAGNAAGTTVIISLPFNM
jgi:hypothetical protein